MISSVKRKSGRYTDEVESENEQCSVVIGIGLNVLLGEESGEMIDQPWTDLATISGRDATGRRWRPV
jgi:biotin-(acetyl-CoA carboxylase) ligase